MIRPRQDGTAPDDRGAARLAQELRDAIQGDVLFDTKNRALYATDASNYRQTPVGVVRPKSKQDVERAVALCRAYGAPVLGRGGGTSLAGQCCNAAVVFDFSRWMNRVLEIDVEHRLARVEPGCVLDTLRAAAREHGLTFGPDPATHDHCTLGGMIGNNSCGAHSVHAQWHTGPRTSDNVHRLEVLTYHGDRFWTGPTPEDELRRILAGGDGRAAIYQALLELRDEVADEVRERYPDIPRRVSGYNLDDLLPEHGFHVARALAGTESTCVMLLEAELHLIPEPRARTLVVLGYSDIYEAADQVTDVMESRPVALEALDRRLIGYMEKRGLHTDDLSLLPDGDGFLLVEFGADTAREARGKADRLGARLKESEAAPDVEVLDDPEKQAAIWRIRESGLGATAFVPDQPDTWPGWEDSAVRPEDLGDYLRQFRALLERYDYDCSFYGHFGHGLLHTRIDFRLENEAGTESFLRFLREAADLVVRYGGSLSGEHGDGQARAALLGRMFGPRLVDAFRRFKSIWDPDGRMNPGKVVDPFLPGDNLRLRWKPRSLPTHFGFRREGGSMERVALRCVGVGKCRRAGGGTMCPSYQVTREEEHSTRGRARLLYEMLRGEVITDGWQSEEVKDALDLCLACKGCRGDCPVGVDMATYKAEFLSHYYEGHTRPRHAWALGRIRTWARLGSPVSPLANWMLRTEPLAGWLKRLGGIHPERSIPAFGRPSFRRRLRKERRRRPQPNPGGPRVIFWADTFNAYFHPGTALAGVHALEALGFRVTLPDRPLCCGRPLYDFGWLDKARRGWNNVLAALKTDILSGVPVVGIEPSCIAAFRDELPNLFPDDELADRLSQQTYLFAEFVERFAPSAALPQSPGPVLYHPHCHQKAVLDWNADRRVLERMGADVHVPDSGCCGMAGSFGFEKEHYDIAEACGERVLLPSVRTREQGVRVVTDGFSCREMIRQGTGVRALNVAELMRDAFTARAPFPRGAESCTSS